MSSGTEKNLKILLDTNILVSAFVYGGIPERVIRLLLKRGFTPIISPLLIEELIDVLMRKFKVSWPDILALEKSIKETFRIVHPSKAIRVVRDEDDNRVLEAAVTGACDYIVTGDKDLLVIKKYRGITIIKPAQFLKLQA